MKKSQFKNFKAVIPPSSKNIQSLICLKVTLEKNHKSQVIWYIKTYVFTCPQLPVGHCYNLVCEYSQCVQQFSLEDILIPLLLDTSTNCPRFELGVMQGTVFCM